jgi:integrase
MNNAFNFTKEALLKIVPPQTNRDTYYDTKERGLSLIVSYGGSKIFYLYKWIDNKPYRIKIGNFPDLSVPEAREKIIELKNQIAKGINPAKEKVNLSCGMTFKQLFDKYIHDYAKQQKKSWQQDVANMNRYATSLYPIKISNIQREDIQKLFNNLAQTGKKVTANRLLALLATIFNKAVEWELLDKNPTNRITKHKEESRERCLTPQEQGNFFKALEEELNHKVRDFILLSLFTAARKSNVLSMRWEDICFTRNTWSILNTKNGRPQLLPLGDKVIEILQKKKKLAASEWVFPSETSKTGHLQEPKKVWARVLKKAGIKDLRLHDLRRTLGSCMGDAGASEYIIGQALNHKSSKSTGIYVRLRASDPVREFMNKAIEKLTAT